VRSGTPTNSPGATTQSEVSTLGKEDRRDKTRRLVIRRDLIDEAKWPTGQQLDLIAEAMEPGRIRLHLEETVRAALGSRKAELEKSTESERDAALAAFAHKFRKATYAPSSNHQLILPTAAAFNLGIQKDASEDVLLEVVGSTIEILSAAFLAQRRERYDDRIIL
jgi:hypothetical protein